jgi:hypothetical protein
MIRYIIPSVGQTLRLERRCPNCQRLGGNIHTAVYRRAISDVKVTSIPQMRMQCPFCKATWTIRPEGISDGRQRSDRLIVLGTVLYMFGLSYRSVEKFLPLLDCCGSKSTIERDVAAVGAKARTLHLSAPRLRVRVLGVDGTGAKMAGKNAGLLFFVDVDRGKLICVEPVKESDSAKLRRHVQKVMAMVGAEELRSDELSVYDRIMPEGTRKICLSHWLKSKCRRVRQLHNQLKAEGMNYEAEQMLELIKYLKIAPRPPTVPDEVSRMGRRFINCRKGILWRVNQLLQHIERTWEHVSCGPADPTNNATERIIGLDYKIRAKTTRGFKSIGKVLNHCYLSEYLRGREGRCDLRKIV